MQSVLYALAVKFLDRDELKMIKERIGMTVLGQMLFEDGMEKGIEKVSKVMMPILAVLTVGIAIYVLTMDGAMDGLKYYLLPNMSNFSVMTVLAAMGQLFIPCHLLWES